MKTHPHSILQVPTTQLAKMSIDLKFVELTADVLEIFFIKKMMMMTIVEYTRQPGRRS